MIAVRYTPLSWFHHWSVTFVITSQKSSTELWHRLRSDGELEKHAYLFVGHAFPFRQKILGDRGAFDVHQLAQLFLVVSHVDRTFENPVAVVLVHQKAPLQKNEKERGKKNWSPPKIQHSTRPFHDFHVKLQDCPKFCSILLCFSIFFLGGRLE